MENERRKIIFDASNMDFEDSDLSKLAYQIQIGFMNLQTDMIKRTDINTLINEHKTDCELCKGTYLTIENCYNEWLICHKKHSDNQIETINKWWEVGKKIIQISALLIAGGSATKIIEVLQ